MAEKLTDEELLTICRREEQDASNWQTSALTSNRSKALQYYDREPLGDEQEGQSQIVTSEFADTIESHMPGLMRVFASGENVAEFTPENQGDEVWAKQASKYVPHVFMRENPGFIILHTTIKDALMYRLGGAVVDLETVREKKKVTLDPSTPITEQEMNVLRQQTADLDGELDESAVTLDPVTGIYSGDISTILKRKKVKVSTIAPEDIRFTPTATSRTDASMNGFAKMATASDLKLMGLSDDDIDELSSDKPLDPEQTDRNPDAAVSERGRTGEDDSERRFWIVVMWVKVDINGDGISEMLRVVYAHAGGKLSSLIDKSEWDGTAPIVYATPILMPHVVAGRSVFDQTKDLQEIGTALQRGMLDNLYITNRPRLGVSSRVDILSVLDWTPGSPVRMLGNENPAEHITSITVPSVIGNVQAAMEYMATVKENRTGVVRNSQGLDANALDGATATGVNAVMGASQQRQELIARVLAETFVKDLMREVYRAIKRAATGPVSFWDGQDWADCDPTKWPDDMDLTVSVGMGTGNKQMELQNLTIVAGAQEKLVALQGGQVSKDSPYVKPEHVANTARKIVEASGQKATQLFIASPKDVEQQAQQPPPAPPPDPAMALAQAQIAADNAKAQNDMMIAQKKQEAEQALAMQRLENERQIALIKVEGEIQVARIKAGFTAQLDAQELQHETTLKAFEISNAPKPSDTEIKGAKPL